MGVRAQSLSASMALTQADGDTRYVNVTGDTMTGALGIAGGSVGAPGLFISGDTDTGINGTGANALAFITGGVQRLNIANDGTFDVGGFWSTTRGVRLFYDGSAGQVQGLNSGGGTGTLAINPLGGDVNFNGGGNVAFDTNVLFVDAGNNRVGVGTATPGNTFEVHSTGPYGINLYNPDAGDEYITMKVHAAFGSVVGYMGMGSPTASNVSLRNVFAVATQSAHPLVLMTNDTERARITAGGNVLVGTTTDDGANKLQVNGSVGLAEAGNIVVGTTTGTKIGTATTQKLGFWNATPIVQPASASQAAVATTGATNVTPFGYTTSAQANAIVTLVNEIRAVLVAEGLMKGAA